MKGRMYFLYALLRHKIWQLPIYITNRCDSRCVSCNIWQKRPKQDLKPDILREMLRDKAITKYTSFGITGGEPLLHPRCKEILSLFSGRDYTLFSNGILADRLIETVREFGIKSLSLSLDGTPSTQKKVRGVDNYSHIQRIVEQLKQDVSIMIGYTINPWNSREDLLHVTDFCRRYGLRLSVGYYHHVAYYEAEKVDRLYSVGDLIDVPYLNLYDPWVSGELSLPCLTTFIKPTIMPNGDVNLCEAEEIRLGNLYEKSLGEVWDSEETIRLQKKYVNCNSCWLDCQRPQDITLTRLLKTFVPRPLLKRFLDDQGWDKVPYIWGKTWRASTMPK